MIKKTSFKKLLFAFSGIAVVGAIVPIAITSAPRSVGDASIFSGNSTNEFRFNNDKAHPSLNSTFERPLPAFEYLYYKTNKNFTLLHDRNGVEIGEQFNDNVNSVFKVRTIGYVNGRKFIYVDKWVVDTSFPHTNLGVEEDTFLVLESQVTVGTLSEFAQNFGRFQWQWRP